MILFQKADAGDLSARKDIKQRAHYDIDWFFANIYPEIPDIDTKSLGWGGVSTNL